jgi:PAS domain S-box-containing protein
MNTDPYISLVENAVEGIFRTSPEGGYIYANPSLARIYGYASPDELKNSVTDIVKQLYVDLSRRSQFVEQIERTGEVRDFISEIWRKDKTKIWIEENARVIRRADGAVECYEGFVTDVTEKMTMIERFRRSERLESLGQLATGIAHDLNNMLGAMRGYAELLSAPDCEKENLRRYAEIIVQASELGADITRKLLSFSKRDERKMRLSEINKIVGEVVGLLERSVRRDIKVELRLSATRSSAYCDPSLLSNAILNLAVNARDAMPSGGSS